MTFIRTTAKSVDPALVLRLFDLRGQIHPNDVTAFRYATMEEADYYAKLNHKRFGHVVYVMLTEIGPVALIDLRKAKQALRKPITDPSLPDKTVFA